MWISTMHPCAKIRTAISEFKNSHLVTTKQHKEKGPINCPLVSVRNPFNENQTKLNSFKLVSAIFLKFIIHLI